MHNPYQKQDYLKTPFFTACCTPLAGRRGEGCLKKAMRLEGGVVKTTKWRVMQKKDGLSA
jgi:hypothetical protein